MRFHPQLRKSKISTLYHPAILFPLSLPTTIHSLFRSISPTLNSVYPVNCTDQTDHRQFELTGAYDSPKSINYSFIIIHSTTLSVSFSNLCEPLLVHVVQGMGPAGSTDSCLPPAHSTGAVSPNVRYWSPETSAVESANGSLLHCYL